MIAPQLEEFLYREASKLDFSRRPLTDLKERFRSLRSFALIPRGKSKNVEQFTSTQVSSSVLSLATEHPKYAGTAAKLLANLRPVGGVSGPLNAETLGQAIENILVNSNILDKIVLVRVSCTEVYINSHCCAEVQYTDGEISKVVHFTSYLSPSLLAKGADIQFNPFQRNSSVGREITFYGKFFSKLSRELQREYPKDAFLHLIEFEEDDPEVAQEKRMKKLGIRPGSRYLNLPVDTQVTWPKEETVVEFRGYKLLLLPKTRDSDTSIHIDLSAEKLSQEEGHTVINRFLSLLCYCCDQFCVTHEGSSGSGFPVSMGRRDLAFATTHFWTFNRNDDFSAEQKLALSLYREGRNAEQNFMVAYSVLSFMKILEIKFLQNTGKTKEWIKSNYQALRDEGYENSIFLRFEGICGEEAPATYIWKACRVAVAHADKKWRSDPDDFLELRRLHNAAHVLRILARRFMKQELGVSDSMF